MNTIFTKFLLVLFPFYMFNCIGMDGTHEEGNVSTVTGEINRIVRAQENIEKDYVKFSEITKLAIQILNNTENTKQFYWKDVYNSLFKVNKSEVPLVRAIQEMNVEEEKNLSALSDEINREDEQGFTPLKCAVCLEDEALVNILLEHGADVNQIDEQGTTLLNLAIILGSQKMVGLLIEKGAEVNLRDENATTSLMYAVNGGEIEIIKLLLPKSNVNVVDEFGSMALSLAVKRKQVDIAKLLLDAGAFVDIECFGISVLNLVEESDSDQIKQLFREYAEKGLLKKNNASLISYLCTLI